MEDAFRSLSDQELGELEIIETLRFDPGQGLVRCDLHLARMARSATAFGFPFDRGGALAALAEASGAGPLRLRLTLNRTGRFKLNSAVLAPDPPIWNFAIARDRLHAADPWLRHKTTRRSLYNRHRAELPPGVDEIVFCNHFGALCEGTISNIFVLRNGVLLTPDTGAGLLPGVLREQLLAQGKARPAGLTLADLASAEALFLGNSLRGLIPARLVSGPMPAPSAP
ncbi:hypothetical protein U879_21060 [Defluviimonas sp. 20V17]|uniref:Probable branched-chain-amino-acid aminotransferase n=1 Tax=Allgaiera indica TaxID=765699 RepID=A0AAN4UT39_9RHOB|nr:aminotransferase class IV family protein [Allgaiera indica]KDB01694.1 hypothetical protein U879_21060 [Defluviimonas sp. 20V17]GHE04010.1 hypothetical protein GCM10008024_29490 [Allgaiera indica]SDX34290.1 4-amino-4-deoxychorismate lyase [Allgaiera indica]